MRRLYNLTFAMLAVVMLAATFTACSSDDDNSTGEKNVNDDEATVVTNDQELRNAMNNGAIIKLANDIQMSNKTLEIKEGTTVTINLDGHTLDRNLTARNYDTGGQVITVRKNATLYLSNGTLTGGWGGASGGVSIEGGTANLTDVTITGCVGDDRGGGIWNNGTLTMTRGAITNNVSRDITAPRGGGALFNAEGAKATLTGVKITGNEALAVGGGGIVNRGTLALDGCAITNNTAKTAGGGIWTAGTAALSMQGAMTITGNHSDDGQDNNVYLREGAVINVTGALTNSKIGVSMETHAGAFTSGYNTTNSGVNPATFFQADMSEVMGVSLDNNEAQLKTSLPEGTIYYIERSWDDAGKRVVSSVKTASDAIELKSTDGAITLTKKLYVVKGNITLGGNILIKPESESVGIVLCDGAKLKTIYNIVFDESTTKAKLHIYGQEANTGTMDMSETGYSESRGPRIGNDWYRGNSATEGEVNIHGGAFTMNAYAYCPCIGSYSNVYDDGDRDRLSHAKSGVINIFGGSINALGGNGAAAIGAGIGNEDYGTINIYGGDITAEGGDDAGFGYSGGSGIGGGMYCYGGTLNIYGGNIKATGAPEAAGIGCGEASTTDESVAGPGDVNIYGGVVFAYGGDHGAGIGYGDGIFGKCNITISGGRVEAHGGVDAAGIGGGEGSPGGTITISGGYVAAYGNDYGAGIGGGQDGSGGNITITGGTVIAKAGRDETGWRAIGPGSGSDDYGRLTLGDALMVSAERLASAAERHDMCWYRTQVRVEPCTHPGYTADTCPYHQH